MRANPEIFLENIENLQLRNASIVTPTLYFSNEEICNLQVAQIPSLTKEQIEKISAQQFSLFSETQLAAFSTEQISFFTREQITGIQYVGNYWAPDIALHQIGISNNSRQLSADQIIALGNKVLCLGTIAIANLSEEATKALREEYIAQLTPGQTRGLNIKFLSSNQIKAIGDGVSGLSATQLADLGTLVSLLSPNATAALTPEQIRTLTPTQVSWFSIQQIKVFKQIQIAALSRSQISSLSIAQIKALFKDTPQYLIICISMCFEFRSNILSREEIIELGDSILDFTANLISKLSIDAIQGIAPKYINQFTKTQIQALNVAALSAEQISALSPEAAAALSPKQIYQMGMAIIHLSEKARRALTELQSSALSLEQAAALAQNGTIQRSINSGNSSTPTHVREIDPLAAPPDPNNFNTDNLFFYLIIQNLSSTAYSHITKNNTTNAALYFSTRINLLNSFIQTVSTITNKQNRQLTIQEYAEILNDLILHDISSNENSTIPEYSNINDPIQLEMSITQLIRDIDLQNTALQDTALQDTALQDTALQDTALQDTALQDTALQDTALQDTALQDTALQDTALQDTALQDTALQDTSFPKTPSTPFLTDVSKDTPNYTHTIFTLINAMASINDEALKETHSSTAPSLTKIFNLDSTTGHTLSS